jgi:hypothetical protein
MSGLDARVSYEWENGVTTLFLGQVASLNAATAGLRQAAEEIHQRGGRNMRVELRNPEGKVVFESAVRGDGAAVS